MSANEYMTTEIGMVMPMLTKTCDELTRQALVRGLTDKTKEWVAGDPELADILLEGKKTLEECVRYVTEKAACVISKNINSMLNSEFEQLPKANIQGREATMAGGAIDAEQVYKWAQEYYYNPDAKPTDFKAEAKRKAEQAKRDAERKNKDAAKKSNDKKNTATTAKSTDKKGDTDANPPEGSSPEVPADKNAADSVEQTSLFDSAQSGSAAA